jgi:hypothetical protein
VALALPVRCSRSTLIRFDYSLLVVDSQAVASIVGGTGSASEMFPFDVDSLRLQLASCRLASCCINRMVIERATLLWIRKHWQSQCHFSRLGRLPLRASSRRDETEQIGEALDEGSGFFVFESLVAGPVGDDVESVGARHLSSWSVTRDVPDVLCISHRGDRSDLRWNGCHRSFRIVRLIAVVLSVRPREDTIELARESPSVQGDLPLTGRSISLVCGRQRNACAGNFPNVRGRTWNQDWTVDVALLSTNGGSTHFVNRPRR